MVKAALTLIEILIAILIVTLAVGGTFLIYPTLFEGVEINSQKVKAWEIARKEIENLKNSDFEGLFTVSYDPADGHPQPEVIFRSGDADAPLQGSAVYYVEKMRDSSSKLLTDLVKLEVVVCFAAGRRIVGEDLNLDGVFSEEDLDGNGKVSSPVSLHTLVISK